MEQINHSIDEGLLELYNEGITINSKFQEIKFNNIDTNNFIPLFFAQSSYSCMGDKKFFPFLEKLIEIGCDINGSISDDVAERYGISCRSIAEMCFNFAFYKGFGFFPLEDTKSYKYKWTIEFFLDRGLTINDDSMNFLFKRANQSLPDKEQYEFLKWFFDPKNNKNGIDINYRIKEGENKGHTLLSYIVSHSNAESADVFIDRDKYKATKIRFIIEELGANIEGVDGRSLSELAEKSLPEQIKLWPGTSCEKIHQIKEPIAQYLRAKEIEKGQNLSQQPQANDFSMDSIDVNCQQPRI